MRTALWSWIVAAQHVATPPSTESSASGATHHQPTAPCARPHSGCGLVSTAAAAITKQPHPRTSGALTLSACHRRAATAAALRRALPSPDASPLPTEDDAYAPIDWALPQA